MNRASFSVFFSSSYFLVFLVSLSTGYEPLAWFLFLFSPFLILYLAYSVIRYGKFTGHELKENQEWGYEDWDKID